MGKKLSLFLLVTIIISSMMCLRAEAREEKGFGKYFEMLAQEVKGEKSEFNFTSLKEDFTELTKKLSVEEAGELIDFIKEQVAEGRWESKDGIEKAIAEGEKKFDVTLSKKDKEKIIALAEKIKELDLDPDSLIATAEKLYDKYAAQLAEKGEKYSDELKKEVEAKVEEEVKKSLSDYFSTMVGRVKSFFKGLFE